MKKYTFDDIRKEGLLIYEYIRGSHAYGLQKPDGTSDVDTAGVYLEPIEQVLGLGLDFQEQIEDEKHDNVWFSLRKFMEMLLSSNPTVLESLFIPEDKILYEHPIMTEIKKYRNAFVTKACFKPFMGYAKTQIIKARGLNKKIVNPVKERLEPLDFAYTFYNQGSTKIKNWLEYRGLKQQYCGLVHIPNMHDTYGVYYDWGNHFNHNGITVEQLWNDYVNMEKDNQLSHMCECIVDTYHIVGHAELENWFEEQKPIGYKGMVGEDGLSNELRLSSVSKGEMPICHLTYNKDGYTKHCKDYKEYKEWERNRNPERYKENCRNDRQFDCYVDKETLFLTNDGWKKYDDVLDTDLIGCFDSNHEIKYSPIKSRTDKLYSGTIYTFESVNTRFSISENHNLYLSSCHRNANNGFNIKYNENTSDWRLISVKDFFNGRRSNYHYITNLSNTLKDNIKYSDDFINLLGMFLSEGSYQYKNGKKVAIRISQLEGRRGCDIMRSITSIPLKEYSFSKRKNRIENTWECRDEFIIDEFDKCIGRYSLDKRIPAFVRTFSKRQFDILLLSMLCGDGSHHKKKNHDVYYTSSKQMAIDLYTLLTLNGYNAQFYGKHDEYVYEEKREEYKRKDGIINPKYQIFISTNNNPYKVLNKRENRKLTGWKRRNVKDERIVCFETEHGTIITMNDYKIAFQGNCKNMSHSVRLMHMGLEIAKTGQVNVDRTNIDRDFILGIRLGNSTYDELINYLDSKKEEMENAMAESTLPENIDVEFVNNLLLKIREKQLNYWKT